MKRALLSLLALSALAACREAATDAACAADRVVIICKGVPYSDRYYLPDGSYMRSGDLQFMRFAAGDPSETIEQPADLGDTIVVPLRSDVLYVHYMFNAVSSSDFVAARGDTVLIERDTVELRSRAVPKISIVNRRVPAVETSYRDWYLGRFGDYDCAALPEITSSILPLLNYLREFGVNDRRATASRRERLLAQCREERAAEAAALDSLHKAGALSDAAYRFYGERNRWDRRRDDVYGGRVSSIGEDSARRIMAVDFDRAMYDSDACGFYRDYIYAVACNVFFSKSVRSSQSVSPDWGYAFERLAADTLLGDCRLKDRLLSYCLDGMAADWSPVRSKPYFERVAEISERAAAEAAERYADLFAEDRMAEDRLILECMDGSRTTLDEVLTELKGKVVYVDFWATWCAPCCAEMPAAAELRARHPEVAFVYLSMDDESKPVAEALENLKLSDCRVYRCVNARSARFLEEHDVRLIPRFMIFDRSGRLVEENAPRPSSDSIDALIGEY